MALLDDWLVVIPSRLAAYRLPRKPLLDLAGKPVIIRVWENLAPLRERGAAMVVATDSEEIQRCCQKFDALSILTRSDHESGTDRVAEAAQSSNLSPKAFVLNVQGDEPFVNTDDLLSLMSAFPTSDCEIGTLAYASTDRSIIEPSHTVKVAIDETSRALYFSRLPIPYRPNPGRHWIHIGVYAFRRESLAAFGKLPPAELENAESLEQLRALAAGWKIHVSESTTPSLGIDTPDDLEQARARIS